MREAGDAPVRVGAGARVGALSALGAVGGAIAGAVALLVLVAAHGLATQLGGLFGESVAGAHPWVVPNAVGAWFVRWLQVADPSALQGFYADATLGGIATAILGGALVGAAFAGFIERYPEDHPLAWGVVFGFVLFALLRWALAPALDPLLLRTVDGAALLAGCLGFGTAAGAWAVVARPALDRAEPAAISP